MGAVDGEAMSDEMSDRERREGFLDGEEDGSMYNLPVIHPRDGSIVHSIGYDIPSVAEQEE